MQQAPGTDPRRLAALARARAARIDPGGAGDLAGAERAAKAARDLVLVADGAGGQVLRGHLDPEGAAIVAAALDPLCAPRPPARTAAIRRVRSRQGATYCSRLPRQHATLERTTRRRWRHSARTARTRSAPVLQYGAMPDVACDADDLHPARAQLETFADRIGARPVLRRRGFAHNHHRSTTVVIGAGEIAPYRRERNPEDGGNSPASPGCSRPSAGRRAPADRASTSSELCRRGAC